jgi:hypothetical protein
MRAGKSPVIGQRTQLQTPLWPAMLHFGGSNAIKGARFWLVA